MRCIMKMVVITLAVCIFAHEGTAQGFRMPRVPHPAPLRPFGFQNNFARINPFITGGFSPVAVSPIVPAGQARFVRGNFNTATGAFTPAPFGAVLLSSRANFEPVRGTFQPAIGGPFLLTERGSVNPKTGNFIANPAGRIVLRERGNLTPSVGSGFSQFATGSFNPFTGAFSPNGNGNFTISSNNGVFVPSNGFFVPSANGNFLITGRGSINPLTGQFFPSQNGNFAIEQRGNFVPTSSFAAASGIPGTALNGFNFASPFNAFSPFNSFSPFGNWSLSPGFAALNPYLPTGFNSYPMSYGYPSAYGYGGGGYGGGYGGYGGGYGGYGGGYGASSGQNYAQQQQPQLASYTPPQQTQQPGPLDAFGIPTENGAIAWPLAFRLMSPEQRQGLLTPVEKSLTAALTQGAAGQANPGIANEARLGVARLRHWLRERRADLAEGTYNDADRFLRKLDSALDAIKAA
jgi:ribosomal protein L29